MSSSCHGKSFASISLPMPKIEKIFLRVPLSLKERWQAAVDETRAPQNQAGIALVEFFLSLSRHQKADLLSGNLEVPDVSDGIGLLDAWEALPGSDQEFVFEQITRAMKPKSDIQPVHDVPPNLKAAAAKVIVDVDRPAREKAKGKRGE